MKDIPKSFPQPAARALINAGILSLDEAAKWSNAELLKLHGFGPKALRILRELKGQPE